MLTIVKMFFKLNNFLSPKYDVSEDDFIIHQTRAFIWVKVYIKFVTFVKT